MKLTAILILVALLSAGCTLNKFSVARDEGRLYSHCRVVADVTCSKADVHEVRPWHLRLHFRPMASRERWTVSFRIENVIKGKSAADSFVLVNGRQSPLPFDDYFWFRFEADQQYKVGFNTITDGVVRGLEILDERKLFATGENLQRTQGLNPKSATCGFPAALRSIPANVLIPRINLSETFPLTLFEACADNFRGVNHSAR